MHKLIFTILFLSAFIGRACSQVKVSGVIQDAASKQILPFVNIGIRHKNFGTASRNDGSFYLVIPPEYERDTLTFSMVGYDELEISVRESAQKGLFLLNAKVTTLTEVQVQSQKLTERKIGIKTRYPAIHFTDGSQNPDDIFEIAQVLKLDTTLSKITSVNLFVYESKDDSATFRINFYAFDGDRPAERIIEKSIVQTKQIKTGWLHMDIAPYNVFLKGRVVVAIEFLPAKKSNNNMILYEIKLGGSSRSFVRKNSLGEWSVPPHHYLLYVTALESRINRDADDEDEDEKESAPAARLFSSFVRDSFSVFIRLPKDYSRHADQKYPVVYLLDANVYFDIISNSLAKREEGPSLPEPILVGIGYTNFPVMDSLRNRDYLYPAALPEDSFATSGGADKFRAFVEDELVPLIDTEYRTDTVNRTIMGHSFGGYFVLYDLLNDLRAQNQTFKNYVAASPSLEYGDRYLLKQFMELPTHNSDRNKRALYITKGHLEDYDDDGTIVNGNAFADFMEVFHDVKFHELNLTSEVFPKFSHMETAIPTFEKGIQLIMKRK